MSPANPILEFERIEKSFFGVRVLRQVSFAVPPGHTLGLVGENGAGKSTLMNILGGNCRPDAGCLRLAGRDYSPRNPHDAARHGIAFIHQELNLFANLSIAENLFIADFPTVFPRGILWIDRRTIRRRTAALLEQVGLRLSPDAPVEALSAGERQLVEIAKALQAEARLVIFDEPTTSLTAREVAHLFDLVRQLRARGLTIIYISHNLGDVLRLADDIVVLRNGEMVGAGARPEFTLGRMVSLMVGRSLQQMFPSRPLASRTDPVLEVHGVAQPGVVDAISFSLHRGEVLGLAGLMGSGRSELARILFGLDPFTHGEIRLAGQPLDHLSPRRCIQRGMAFLTEDRRENGLCLEASIADNIALVALPGKTRSLFRLVDGEAVRDAVAAIRQAVRLTPAARDEQPVKTLSGGNQQKVVLAKWLLANPSVVILDEPTRGIDVGAKVEIYHLINELAGRGAGVLVISSEIEELIGLCDRILVLSRGRIHDRIERKDFDRERLLCAALAEYGPGRSASAQPR
ncbi:MAG: sugar ABC transporter ATP-binding protein [Limisphaerales bacterium]